MWPCLKELGIDRLFPTADRGRCRDKRDEGPTSPGCNCNRTHVRWTAIVREPRRNGDAVRFAAKPDDPSADQRLPRSGEYRLQRLQLPSEDPNLRCEPTTPLPWRVHPKMNPPQPPTSQCANGPWAKGQIAQQVSNQPRTSLRYFTRLGPESPKRFFLFSSYSLYVPSNQYTCESPSKARMCVQIRSRK